VVAAASALHDREHRLAANLPVDGLPVHEGRQPLPSPARQSRLGLRDEARLDLRGARRLERPHDAVRVLGGAAVSGRPRQGGSRVSAQRCGIAEAGAPSQRREHGAPAAENGLGDRGGLHDAACRPDEAIPKAGSAAHARENAAARRSSSPRPRAPRSTPPSRAARSPRTRP
jgi:hypothetical protein